LTNSRDEQERLGILRILAAVSRWHEAPMQTLPGAKALVLAVERNLNQLLRGEIVNAIERTEYDPR
jgi:hypothetical protein